jgi:hypothetical protein
MQAEAFLLVVATCITVMLISLSLDYLWAQFLPARVFYYVIRAPGVILHECSHIAGCIITGAKIKKVVLFSKGGGSVTYFSPRIPYIGDVIISTAPVFCIPLVLAGCTWVFSHYLGCWFPENMLSLESAGTLKIFDPEVLLIFTQNIVVKFNAWFFLYLYLTISLVLSAAPSIQDIRNAAIGIGILTAAGVLIFWSGVPWAVNLLWEITRIVGMGFALGLGSGLVALVCSVPVIIWYLYRHVA